MKCYIVQEKLGLPLLSTTLPILERLALGHLQLCLLLGSSNLVVMVVMMVMVVMVVMAVVVMVVVIMVVMVVVVMVVMVVMVVPNE